MSSVAIVRTGTANTASVVAAFRRLGVETRIVGQAEVVESCDRVVLPGVGSFGAAATELERRGLRQALQLRIAQRRPTLAICVGMQLLAPSSEESPGVEGLGIFTSQVERFADPQRVPQLGWNLVVPQGQSRFLSRGWAYFANSYRIAHLPDGWSVALTDYGGDFASAAESGDVLACQFHPELSGAWGAGVLARWLQAIGGVR